MKPLKVNATKECKRPVTISLCGNGWEFSVTGSQAWTQKMVKDYVPKIQEVVNSTRGSTNHHE